jgi:ribosome maturation factor RimP
MENKVRELIEDEVNKLGVKIDSVLYEKEGGNYFLRIVIDRDEVIDIDTCVEVTNVINPLLDKADFLSDSYILDVSTKEKGERSE